ncbi:hypothetical protein K438DRAFT_1976238 [Mycena galopus ATCC 62051]|nr:hypothetical protein K438DRAFT_1976238 [Mycena galopus ATCC 62051]
MPSTSCASSSSVIWSTITGNDTHAAPPARTGAFSSQIEDGTGQLLANAELNPINADKSAIALQKERRDKLTEG